MIRFPVLYFDKRNLISVILCNVYAIADKYYTTLFDNFIV